MKWLIQRFFLIFLSAWMLIGNSGISWTQETCLFTGHTKTSVDVTTKSGQSPKPHFSRASCYQYDHFQLKFGIDHVIQKKSSPAAEVILIHSFDPKSVEICRYTAHWLLLIQFPMGSYPLAIYVD